MFNVPQRKKKKGHFSRVDCMISLRMEPAGNSKLVAYAPVGQRKDTNKSDHLMQTIHPPGSPGDVSSWAVPGTSLLAP